MDLLHPLLKGYGEIPKSPVVMSFAQSYEEEEILTLLDESRSSVIAIVMILARLDSTHDLRLSTRLTFRRPRG
jgi:hypothetical protein